MRLKEQSLPEVNTGEKIKNEKIELLDKKTQPPSRYTQASILKEMEKLGLGTKATRAQILQTLYDRGYIKEKSIVVTELGEAVVKALEHHCPEIISVDLTRKLENEMEEIERGNKKRGDILLEARRNLERILQNFKKHERKIGEEILEALKRFEKNKNVRFIFAGTGPDMPKFINRAVELGIQEKTMFLGFVPEEEKAVLYKIADVVVCPSVSEPFGIVPLEALSAGTPVIISKQSGVSEVLSNAMRVDFWDVREMASKILEVIHYRELREELREHGIREVRNLSWERTAEDTLKAYGWLMG